MRWDVRPPSPDPLGSADHFPPANRPSGKRATKNLNPTVRLANPMGNGEFDGLAREFFDWTMEKNPHLATNLGLHQFDGRLPDGSRGAAIAEIEGWTKYRQRFAALDPEDLSGSRPLDRELALFLLDLWVYQGKELRLWEAIPAAPEVLGSALLPLLVRDSAPLAERMSSITERLRGAPKFLEESKGRIRRPVRLWGEMAFESATALPSLLATIEESTAAKLEGPSSEAFEDARRAAEEALVDHARWLQSEVVERGSEENTIGSEAFHRLLELRHIDMNPEELRALGLRYLQESQEELRRIAGQIDPKATVEEVKERLRSDHPPTFEAVLDENRRATVQAREFVQRHLLATLPRAEELMVIATPGFLRHVLPFAAYFGPGRWEAKQQGLFMVTPPVGQARGGQGRAALRNTAVHEGYPGHHLQQVCANLNPSLIRQLVGDLANPEVVEGWAHYCEEMMREKGFDASPEGRFVQVADVIWRACRVLIDVELHSGRMGFDGAVELLVREAGMSRDSAVGEVKRYTQNPTYQLSYLLGKHMIKGLQDEVKARLGPRYSDRFFHDTILYSGGLPMVLLRRVLEDKMGVFEEALPE